jgi:hypothetical protein
MLLAGLTTPVPHFFVIDLRIVCEFARYPEQMFRGCRGVLFEAGRYLSGEELTFIEALLDSVEFAMFVH